MVKKIEAPVSMEKQEQMKLEKQFDNFNDQVKEMTLDRMNAAPKPDIEAQTKLSQKEIEKSKDIYIKPFKTISCSEKFNEKYREDYEFAKEYVYIVAENKEIIGEEIDLWTKPYAGVPAQEWKIPVNKPVWVPRFVAERIHGCTYHRLTMQQNVHSGSDHSGQYYGSMAVDTTIQRLDAIPMSQRKSIFMGAGAGAF